MVAQSRLAQMLLNKDGIRIDLDSFRYLRKAKDGAKWFAKTQTGRGMRGFDTIRSLCAYSSWGHVFSIGEDGDYKVSCIEEGAYHGDFGREANNTRVFMRDEQRLVDVIGAENVRWNGSLYDVSLQGREWHVHASKLHELVLMAEKLSEKDVAIPTV